VRSFAPHYSAASYRQLLSAMMSPLLERAAGASGPPMTNAEAVAFVRAWWLLSTDGMVPADRSNIAAQFAARAYGWNPPQRTYLRRDALQARGGYPSDLVSDLALWAREIATQLDARGDQPPPGIAVNREAFADPTVAAWVKAELLKDGYDAAFKMPVGTCKDTKTGKQRFPLPPCDDKGRGPLVGVDARGRPVFAPCDAPGACEPVLVDDPITVLVEQTLLPLAAMVAAVWLLTRDTRRSRRS
jgi:hypothetical protein